MQKKFYGGDGEGGARDYHAHKRRFKEVTDIDGLSDRAISEELRHWFGGTAWRMIQGWAEARDSKRALVKVWEELDEAFGQEELSAEDRLAELMAEGKVNADKPNDLLCLAADLRNIYEKARESYSHHLLDDEKVLNRVLEVKVPTFHEKWLENMIARRKREEDKEEEVEQDNMGHIISELKVRAKMLQKKGSGPCPSPEGEAWMDIL